LREKGSEYPDKNGVFHGGIVWRTFVNTVMDLQLLKNSEFHDELGNDKLFMKDTAP
jgi:hypothetical protein